MTVATLPVRASDGLAGDYLCRVDEIAGIASTHLEGASPPSAYSDKQRTVFKMRVSASRANGNLGAIKYTAIELKYDGPDRDTAEWHTANSVLHSAYVGAGTGGVVSLTAVEDQGFMRFAASSNKGNALWFYHSGFQYAGGEDVQLAVRYGTCQALTKSKD